MGTVKEKLMVELLSNPQSFAAEIAWLREAARYFANRQTGGEDAAHWANVYNAENATNLADRLSEMNNIDPVPVTIFCPSCSVVHIDEGEWETRRHKTHQCQGCGYEWRPFPFATVGVESVLK